MNSDLINEASAFLDGDGGHVYDVDLIRRLTDKLEQSQAALGRVRAKHQSGVVYVVASDGCKVPRRTCLNCSRMGDGEMGFPGDVYLWPCPTIKALEGQL